jgi:hypothetical protein
MNTSVFAPTTFPSRRTRRRAAVATLCCTIPLLAGCGAGFSRSTACGGNNFEGVELVPGCSAICAQEPCKVWFVMPEGAGSYPVRGKAVAIGEYPAGQTVFLGSFWRGSHQFVVEGMDAPPAYLFVSGGGSDGPSSGN